MNETPRRGRAPSIATLLLAALVGATAAATGSAAPARILLIRHAEKPADGPELNARGYQRANALAVVFTHDPRLTAWGRPAALISGAPQKPGGSIRSIQTLEPLSRALGIPLITTFRRDDTRGVAAAILSDRSLDGRTVIVCWEHKRIPEIVRALGWTSGPTSWPDDTFDRIWVLTFDAGGKPVGLDNLPERALPGDSQN